VPVFVSEEVLDLDAVEEAVAVNEDKYCVLLFGDVG